MSGRSTGNLAPPPGTASAAADGPHPYEALTPDAVLAAVETAGLICDGRLLALNSYENRVYQVGIEDERPVVAKFYRPGRWSDAAIEEEHAFAAELEALEVPVVAPLPVFDGGTLGSHGGFKLALFPMRPGRWPDLETREQREQMGRFVGRLHAVGAVRDFQHRPTLSTVRFGWHAIEALQASNCVPPDVAANVYAASENLLRGVETCIDANPARRLRVHGDFHLGNVLWADSGPSIVDLDDCLSGPAVQDLWMLLDGDRGQRESQLLDVLRGYRQFHDFDLRELAQIEALRGLRMVRHNGWLAARWADPAFPRAFPWFTTAHYWEEQMVALREQLAVLDEPPLDPYGAEPVEWIG